MNKEEEEKKLVSLLGEWDSSRRRLTRLFSGILGSSQSHDSNQLDKILRSAGRVQEINGKLFRFERGFISEDGMKGRTWYRHMGVAPDRHSGNFEPSTVPRSMLMNQLLLQATRR